MKNRFLKSIQLSLIFFSAVGYAQNLSEITVNKGQLYVQQNTLVSNHFDFKNEDTGIVFNNGEFQLYKNYDNNGLFTYSTNQTTGNVSFIGENQQVIKGAQPSKFNNILFNNTSAQYAFQLEGDAMIDGTSTFKNGIVVINKEQGGKMLFTEKANHVETSDLSYAQGMVEKLGNVPFVFPIGDQGFYRFAGISSPASNADSYTGEYFLVNSNTQYPHTSKTGILDRIDEKEYWEVKQENPSKNSVVVTLSWDERTTPADLLVNESKNLHIARWDDKQQLWVDEGGIVDYANKTVRTLTDVEGFGVFTLATIKPELLQAGDIVIYNGVTPNGDGVNDYFIIDNLHLYPNNTVRVFNRWGREVFYTTAYNTNGNVFKGIAEGKGIVNKGETLPTGTYYYVLEYTINVSGVESLNKKVGYIHLEMDK